MKYNNQILIFLLIVLVAVTYSCSTDTLVQHENLKNNKNNKDHDQSFEVANTFDELQVLRDDYKSGIIRDHTELSLAIRNDDLLNEVFTDEILYDFLKKIKFNDRGIVTFDYGVLIEAYPSQFEEILNHLTPKLGFNFDALAYIKNGSTCYLNACQPAQGALCDPDNCADFNVFNTNTLVIDVVNEYWSYVKEILNPEFVYYQDEYAQFPVPKTSDWIFETFDLQGLYLEEESYNWLVEHIEKKNIVAFGSTTLSDNEEVAVAYLAFSNTLAKPVVFEKVNGIFIDEKHLKYPNDMRWYYYESGSNKLNCSCEIIFSTVPKTSECNKICYNFDSYVDIDFDIYKDLNEKTIFNWGREEWRGFIFMQNLEKYINTKDMIAPEKLFNN